MTEIFSSSFWLKMYFFKFLVEETREAPRQCTCPNGEANCVCPSPEILEPVHIPINSGAVRRSPQSSQVSYFFNVVKLQYFSASNSLNTHHAPALNLSLSVPVLPKTLRMSKFYFRFSVVPPNRLPLPPALPVSANLHQ